MKQILFSLICIANLCVFTPLLAQEPATNEELLDYIKTRPDVDSKEDWMKPASPELEAFLEKLANKDGVQVEDQMRPGESATDFIKRRRIENQIRDLYGEDKLPDALISTNPPASGMQNPAQPSNPLSGQKPPVTDPSTWMKPNPSQPVIKTPTTIDEINSIVPPTLLSGQPLNELLNQLFYIGLVGAVILAIVMIIRGGVEYMTIDAIASKENGKNRVKAALGGLLLSFSAILILNTINPGLTNLKIKFEELKGITSINVFGGLVSIPRPGAGTVIPTGQTHGSWEEYVAEDWVKDLSDGVRSTDGRLVVTSYSATGDAVTDSNTAARRGNANNLLREGSVALSPDLIAQYKPQTGQEVFINGVSVGFYEDATAAEYKGVTFKNTIDIYDENKTLGSKLKNIPAGEWKISFGGKRAQVSNP